MERGSTIRIGERKHDQDWREKAQSGLERGSTIRLERESTIRLEAEKKNEAWSEENRIKEKKVRIRI